MSLHFDLYSDLTYTFPSYFYNQNDLNQLLKDKRKSFKLIQKESESSLTIHESKQDCLISLREIFSELNGISNYPIQPFRNSPTPLVSCVILLTGNDYFVKKLQIPSLIANSQNHQIEIIISYNGPRESLEEFSEFPVVYSDFGWVSKAYNAGVKVAKGKYVAIFHDDCLIDDPHWIEKSVALLQGDTLAVTPELHPPSDSNRFWVGKNVPLFLQKKDFDSLNGYDENYFIGIEDIDFTYGIFSHGKKIEKVPFKHFHGAGMSTIICRSDNPHLFQILFGLNAIPLNLLKKLQSYYVQKFKESYEFINLRLLDEQAYFFNKFQKFLSEKGEYKDLPKVAKEHKSLLANDSENLSQLYRQLMHFESLYDSSFED